MRPHRPLVRSRCQRCHACVTQTTRPATVLWCARCQAWTAHATLAQPQMRRTPAGGNDPLPVVETLAQRGERPLPSAGPQEVLGAP
jgi:hypothetical protein